MEPFTVHKDPEVLETTPPNLGEPDKKPLYSPTPDEPLSEVVTDEMKEYSEARTGKHIARVVALGEELGFDFSEHDRSKFSPELYLDYVLIDNSYRKDLDPPIPYTERMAEASFIHIKTEPHHPEYWDDNVVARSNQVGRDEPDVGFIVNATEMPIPAICEMVCDWVAMSMELNSNPNDWADANIGVRWEFTDDQKDLICLVIGWLWDESLLKEKEVQAEETVRVVTRGFDAGYRNGPNFPSWRLNGEPPMKPMGNNE